MVLFLFFSLSAGGREGGVIKSDMELELRGSVFLADQARPPKPGLRCIVVRRRKEGLEVGRGFVLAAAECGGLVLVSWRLWLW